MPDVITNIIFAIGLVFVIEGFLYALFPTAMKKMMAAALEQNENNLRTAGLIAAFIGLVIIYVIK
ncbi:MAG: DUF2065 domain-containing protein [Kordiimonadaceae bacterium]|jgi:uncharacterized protein|nr:DUF2065 domain-containing protein [Kordiimonadaceae bacterium]MBT6035621.1 DUF2065 domain-containing protein [Kordiimonadaceae bacterium]MBT6329907.1 DUF2065 domain-containing protein [Kordiimonadaceae bacterium]MBT7582097.1 DUF2065 domain-containing protein [Kordiimonadaceae bacterium]